MGSRHAVWLSVLMSLVAGCQCTGGGADAGRARDALAPCPDPIQLLRYELDPAVTAGAYGPQLVALATVPDVVLAIGMAHEDGTDFPVTRFRIVLAQPSADGVVRAIPMTEPAGVWDLVDAGDVAVVLGDGWAARYGPDGWGPRQPTGSAERAVGCGRGVIAQMGATLRVEDWSPSVPRLVAEGAAPADGTLLDCVAHEGGEVDVALAARTVDGTEDLPVLVHVAADGTLTSSRFGAAPIMAATFDGFDLLTADSVETAGQPTIVRLFRIEGGTARQRDERRSAYAVQGTGTVHPSEAGRLFVTGLVGFAWDGERLGAPWPIADLSTARSDHEGTWWVMEEADTGLAELRFCRGGS